MPLDNWYAGHADTVPTGTLCPVELGIGPLDELFDRVALDQVRSGDSDTDCDDVFGIDRVGFGQGHHRLAQAFGDAGGGAGVGVGHDDGELLAAEAGSKV